MSIDLYYMSLSPPSRAVLLTANLLGIEVNVKPIDLFKGENKSEEYLKLNPCHKVPTIVDGDLTLWESRAIMQYLCNQYGRDSSLYPKDAKKRAVVDKMLDFDMSYTQAIQSVLCCCWYGGEPTVQQIKNYKEYLELMNTLIGDHKFVAGNHLTIADISIAQSTTELIINDYKDLADYPKLKIWYEGIQTEIKGFNDVTDKPQQELVAFIAAKKGTVVNSDKNTE